MSVAVTNRFSDGPGLDLDPKESARIARIKDKYQCGPAYISVERARYFTESWRETEGQPPALRVARAMKRVYERMTHYLDPDDRIAGYWCEYFLGVPIDIERGVFNSVLEAELDKKAMVRHRAGSMAKGMSYMLRKGLFGEFMKNQKIAKQSGAQALNLGFKTMSEREINRYQITAPDRKLLLKELLPFWKGKTVVDLLERELLDSELLSREMRDFVHAIPGNTSRQVIMLSTCATIASYHAHMILDYDAVLTRGLLALHEEIANQVHRPGLSGEARDFLAAEALAVEGVIIFARRLAERIEAEAKAERDPERRTVLEQMLAVCRKVPLLPAENFRESAQAMWTVKTAVETAHPVYLHCFGRLDQILYPYYHKDMEAGALTRGEAVALLSELLLKIMSQNVRPESNILGNFYHRFLGSSPITLAGMKPDGRDGTNELTHVFLDAAHLSRAVTNVSVRISERTPDSVLDRVARHLAAGTSSFSLFADEINIEAMKRRGFSEEDARDYAVMGCVETTCPGRTGPMSANALQLAKLLDITLRNGDSRLLAGTIKKDGLATGDPDTFQAFDQFLEAFYRQADYFMDKIVAGSNIRDRIFAERLPAPHISAFVKDCLDKKKDVTAGGGRYVFAGISTINSIANLVDSLLAIKKLVFEQKKVTFKQYLDALDNNFNGHDDLRREIEKIEGMWGNGEPESDALAAAVMKRLFDRTYHYRTWAGGPVVAYIISMITHTIDGRLSIATPDGRRAAKPYAASCNPYNVERRGVTAAMRSVAALPFEDVMGCAVNMKFHPSAVGRDDEARKKWAALVRTYFALGGSQLQPTVVSAETLRAAKAEPERHKDLIVKVGGYSTYFVDLGREIQDEIIARTEHGA